MYVFIAIHSNCMCVCIFVFGDHLVQALAFCVTHLWKIDNNNINNNNYKRVADWTLASFELTLASKNNSKRCLHCRHVLVRLLLSKFSGSGGFNCSCDIGSRF